MTDYEMDSIIEMYQEKYQDSWEQTRTISHAVIASQSSKPVYPEEIYPFPWDKKKDKNSATLSDKDKERLKQKIEKGV